MLPAVLAVDGGNSKTDVALVAEDGTLLAQVRGPRVPNRLSAETLVLLDELTAAVARQAGVAFGGAAGDGAAGDGAAGNGAAADGAAEGPAVARHTVACMANVDLPEEERRLAGMLRSRGWSHSVDVANDTVALLRAGLDGRLPAGLPGGRRLDGAGPGGGGPGGAGPDDGARWGVAVTCGAGINCVGIGPDGETTGFLALGTLTGDWGGGHGLASEVMWWAARAEDGRGPQTLLREAAAAHFGVAEVRDALIGLHLGSIPYERLHGLVPVLFEVSRRGDQVARDLVHRQADEVALMALTVIRRLGLTGAAVPVVLGGGVLTARDPVLTERLAARLAAGAPSSIMRIVDIPPIAGAALLGLDHVGAPPAAHARLRAAYLEQASTSAPAAEPAQHQRQGPAPALGAQ